MDSQSNSDHPISRRKVGSIIAVGGITSLAGCVESVGDMSRQVLGQPSPKIVDTEASQGLGDYLSGEQSIRVLVKNNGGEGEIAITIEFQDASGTVIKRDENVVSIQADEQREYRFNVESPQGVEEYRIRAEAV